MSDDNQDEVVKVDMHTRPLVFKAINHFFVIYIYIYIYIYYYLSVAIDNEKKKTFFTCFNPFIAKSRNLKVKYYRNR